MIVKCPKCGAELKFDPITQMMRCEHCNQMFDPDMMSSYSGEKRESVADKKKRMGIRPLPWDFSDYEDAPEEMPGEAAPVPVSSDAAYHSVHPDDTDNPFGDTLEMNVYHCSACGGEILVNGLETSTFCPYCGQPTIVFDRTSRELKPKYILPFEITKEQAIALIRYRFNQGWFIPKAIKNFSVEQIKGIYVPYWLVEIYYRNKIYLKGEVEEYEGNEKKKHTYYFMRDADVTFEKLTMDASRRLINEYSKRLEPFNTRKLAPFQVHYLSGFYADRYDVEKESLTAPAAERAGELFEDEVMRRIPAKNVSVVKRETPKAEFLNAEYAMLPVWFMTFRYQGEPYTIMVNGQTGKVVGGVPFHKSKMALLLSVLTVLFSVVAVKICHFIVKYDYPGGLIYVAVIAGVGINALARGFQNLKRVMKSIGLTRAEENIQIISDREKEK